MKKILLSITAVVFSAAVSFGQVQNSSFETWGLDTSYLDLSFIGFPADTFTFQDPLKWTSSNTITGADSLGAKTFVTKATGAGNFNTGTASVVCKTDSVIAPLIGKITIPGFVVSGDFKLDLLNLVSGGGGGFSLSSIPGAGSPLVPARRVGQVTGYYKYSPAGAIGADSCAAIAVLKKGATVVATAEFFAKAAQPTFTTFTADFVYSSCEIPDSFVIILSSSNPYVLAGLQDGSTASLPSGSRAWFDDISLVDTTVTFTIDPVAIDDAVAATKNTAKTIDVTANDAECYGRALTVTTGATSSQGGTTVVSGTDIVYTPANNFLGVDSFNYSIIATGTPSSSATVIVTVSPAAGINNLNNTIVSVFPNPAQNILFVEAEVSESAKLIVTDLIGRTVATENETDSVSFALQWKISWRQERHLNDASLPWSNYSLVP